MRQVHHQAGEESRFGYSQQKPSPVEFARGVDESGERGDHSPRNHDARDPLPGAPQFHEQRSRNLEKHVAEKEHAGAEAEYSIRETQFAGHVEPGETDVDPIEKSDDVKDKEEGHQAAADALTGTVPKRRIFPGGSHGTLRITITALAAALRLERRNIRGDSDNVVV